MKKQAKTEKEPGLIKRIWSKFITYLTIILLIGLGIGIGIEEYRIHKLTKSFTTEKVEIQEKANTFITEQSIKGISQTIKPLTWAIRSEMIRNNKENVDIYVNQFVKDENIAMVLIIGNDSLIWSSTDKKMENENFTKFYDKSLISSNDIYFDKADPKHIIIASPLMGIDNRMGTLIIEYTPVYFELNTEDL